MRRVAVASITFEFDEDNIGNGPLGDLTNEEITQYARNTMADDIYQLSINNELHSAIRVTLEKRK